MEVEVNSSIKDNNNFTQITPDNYNCNLCGLLNVHKNDLQAHIESRSHQRKVREKQKTKDVNEDEEQRFHCDTCDKTLKGEEYYKAHLGSKTHKRNLKKYGLKGKAKPAVAPLSQVTRGSRKSRRISIGDNLDEHVYAVFTRQKYKAYPMNDNLEYIHFKTYIYSLTSYLSLRLALDPTVTDFLISVNDKTWEPFGNVVIRLFFRGKKTVYAIQCRKVNQVRQINYLEEARVDLEKQYNGIARLKESGKDISNAKFVIFSTCSTSSNFNQSVALKAAVLNKWKTSSEDILLDSVLKLRTKKNEIINVTSDPENVYSFTLSQTGDCSLPKLFFYTNQRIFPSMLNTLLKSRFDKNSDISAEYMKYIGKWIEGGVRGNFKLTKRDAVLKIGELLLNPYIHSPKQVLSKHDAFPIWNQVISQVDLTILRNENFVISKVCQPLNMVIEETLFTTIDTITKSVNLKNSLDKVAEPIKSYVFEVVKEPLKVDIPLHLIYNVFWKAGRIPLLMSLLEEEEDAKGFILDVILFMKQMGVHNKFILKCGDFNLNRYKGDLKIFTSLQDIESMMDMNEVKIWVSDSFQLPLREIMSTDPFFSKWVTPNIFFDISIGRYSFKPSYSLKKIHNKMNVLKIILNDDVKDKLERQLYPERELSEIDRGYYSSNRLRGIEPNIL